MHWCPPSPAYEIALKSQKSRKRYGSAPTAIIQYCNIIIIIYYRTGATYMRTRTHTIVYTHLHTHTYYIIVLLLLLLFSCSHRRNTNKNVTVRRWYFMGASHRRGLETAAVSKINRVVCSASGKRAQNTSKPRPRSVIGTILLYNIRFCVHFAYLFTLSNTIFIYCGLVWRGGWPMQSLTCSEAKHQPESLVPGGVTTRDFSDKSSQHTHYTRVPNRTLPHSKNRLK